MTVWYMISEITNATRVALWYGIIITYGKINLFIILFFIRLCLMTKYLDIFPQSGIHRAVILWG